MEIQRYKVEDKDLIILNKFYIFLNYKPFAYGHIDLGVTFDYAVSIMNKIIDSEAHYMKLSPDELKMVRNTCFSDNQISFIEAAEKAGYDVHFKLNSYGAFDPYIISTTVDEKMKKFSLSSYSENQDEVFFRFEKVETEYPMRGMYNGRWVDYFHFIAVQ